MKDQWQAYPLARSAIVLGVAGGNGLEYCGKQLEHIYGIDINKGYLESCHKRFGKILGPKLHLIQMDVGQPQAKLPRADLLLADLVIEYVGVEIFCQKAAASQAKLVSCVIQLPGKSFVSNSPYQDGLQAIGVLHQDIAPEDLQTGMGLYGYEEAIFQTVVLPDGKWLLRADYQKYLKE